jgi:hypothetical protein
MIYFYTSVPINTFIQQVTLNMNGKMQNYSTSDFMNDYNRTYQEALQVTTN